ncbi:MAG TPA: hypothetical protein VK477_14350, partial [Acidobacteriota bacterium]|nr:hypothetical protein [Acidobacteriota bacterium]
GQVAEAVLTIDFRYEEGAKGDFQPIVRNVQLENVVSSASPRAFYIRGIPNGVIENIRVKNCQFNELTEPEVVVLAGSVSLVNVTLTPKKMPKGANSVPAPEAAKK